MKATGCIEIFDANGWRYFPVNEVFDPSFWAESLAANGVTKVCVVFEDEHHVRYADYFVSELPKLDWAIAEGRDENE